MLFEARCIPPVSVTLSVNVHLTVVHVTPASPEEDKVQSEAQSKTPDTASINHGITLSSHRIRGRGGDETSLCV